MKKILPLVLLGCAMQAQAQNCDDEGRFLIGANFKYGQMKERMTIVPATAIYPNALNYSRTPTNTEKGRAFGFEAQLGYFFSPDNKWGLGTGLMYLKSEGEVSIDATHFEYQSTDHNGDVFRQVITSTAPIREELDITNISIPLVVKYRTPICENFGFNIDAGIVYNVKMETSYIGTAAYNYEAIYRFDNSSGQPVAVYDNHPIPQADDFLITAENYNGDNPNGDATHYFETFQSQGYNVGLKEEAGKSGKVEHKSGTVGILLQPSFSYKISDVISLNLGGYFMFQKFKEKDSRTSMMTDKVGEYNTLLDNASRRRQHNYGLSAGLSLCF